eukprot:CAMPEP_0204337048 /NCGR_PEP_ID=MMETSP0469-20131031/20007_1 /ASSEMBLY_ACC=CAM_ASM_000384 /TAXON_ID=2969 /ORGANISM="Oxyrrhis marina" /LENGTH=345 /DNA_ID=CAMNT_0051321015 /DNA_START=36 /DNA_END=1073 /DNA_ORIENTATION=-
MALFLEEAVETPRGILSQVHPEALQSAIYILFFSTAISSYLLLSGTVQDQEGPEYGLPGFLVTVFVATTLVWVFQCVRSRCSISGRDVLLSFPWAVFYLLTWYLPLWTLQYISAGQFIVLLQSRLLATPFLSYVFIGEKRSALQVVALGILLCGVLGIVIPDESQEVSFLGIGLALLNVVVSTVSMVYTQYACEKCSSKHAFSLTTGVHIVIMNALLWLVEASTGAFSPRIRAGSFLVLYWLACGAVDISTTVVLTKVSAVGVSLGAAITVPVTMMVEVATTGAAVDKHDTLAAMTVAGAVIGYAMATQEHQALTSLQTEARAALARTGLHQVAPAVVGAVASGC